MLADRTSMSRTKLRAENGDDQERAGKLDPTSVAGKKKGKKKAGEASD